MVRYLIPILLLASPFIASIQVWASCDINEVLEGAFHSQPIHRTTWYQNNVESLQTPAYVKLIHPEPHQLIHVEVGSISEKNIEPLHILEDSDSMQMGVNEFKEQTEKVLKKRIKDRYDYLNFYESRYQIYRSAMDEFLIKIKKIDPLHAQSWENAVKAQTLKVHQIYKLARGDSTGKYIEYWQEFHNNILGSTAELQVALSLPKVDRVSLKLTDSPLIKQNLTKALNQAATDANVINVEQFPYISQNPLMRVKGETKRSAVEKWILSKEIDVASDTSWLEVKRNQHFLNFSDFSKSRRSINHMGIETFSKSYKDQILETKEILRYLGLEKQIQLQYLATGGMDQATRSFLQSNGIKVLNH